MSCQADREKLTVPESASHSCCGPSRAVVEANRAETIAPPSSTAVRDLGRTVESGDPRDKSRMIPLTGGTFRMGTDDPVGFRADGEGPVRSVTISPFRIEPYAVTNADFAWFVDETGYVTETERFGWSYVYVGFLSRELRKVSQRPEGTPWWAGVRGAHWQAPEGPGSTVADRLDHPVTHLTWNDASAFAQWAGKRLPSEAEWEYAARGGLDQARYPWGDELTPDGRHRCNIWQGRFPVKNTAEDGFSGTAPVDAYDPNGFGLFNVSGNVWEWCADNFSADHSQDPGIDPTGPKTGQGRVMRGGSYMCHDSYCNRYRVAARTSNTPDSSGGHLGVRLAADFD